MARTPKPWYRKDRRCWFVTINGRRHNLGPDKTEALKLFHQLMAAPPDPLECPVESDSVAAVIDEFLEWAKLNRAKRTYEWYLQRCQWFIRVYPNLRVADLKPHHVQKWIDANPHWADGHKRGCIIAIQRPLRWAMKMGLIAENAVLHMEKPQQGRREEVLTAEQVQLLVTTTRDQNFKDLMNVAWETGARPQELLNVEARHIDVGNGRWVFPTEESKGKRRPRVVYLSDDSLKTTTRLMKEYPVGKLFRNTSGRPWKPFAVNCRFRRLHVKTGIKTCLYVFRHSFATRMLESGVDALTVSVLMGHSDTSMLGRVYQHLSHNPELLRKRLKDADGETTA